MPTLPETQKTQQQGLSLTRTWLAQDLDGTASSLSHFFSNLKLGVPARDEPPKDRDRRLGHDFEASMGYTAVSDQPEQ